ncbi:MAG TPA: hypothetical protein VMD58_02690 [Acidobacteriaceae bacterium]|nr:hypothetical protein [Acidobacteriaceae bacterium]
MQSTRRGVMLTMGGAVAAILASRLDSSTAEGQLHPTPQPLPSPNAPTNMNAPVQLGQQDIPLRGPGNPIPPATWNEIKADAQKLYQMAAGFATQVDNTNVAQMLPLSLLREAHAIEKLAKHIQSRMKS